MQYLFTCTFIYVLFYFDFMPFYCMFYFMDSYSILRAKRRHIGKYDRISNRRKKGGHENKQRQNRRYENRKYKHWKKPQN